MVKTRRFPVHRENSVWVKSDETTEIEVVLSAGVVVVGRAVDPAGVAIEGAKVRFGNAPEDALSPPRLDKSVTTDENGEFLLSNLAVGTRLSGAIEHMNFARLEIDAFEALEDVDLGTIRLSRGASIRGRVVDATKTPIQAAEIAMRRSGVGQFFPRENDARHMRAHSASDGTFLLQNLAAGTFRLSVSVPRLARFESERITLARDDELDIGDIVIGDGETIHGVVVDSTGEPIRGAKVNLIGLNVRFQSEIQTDNKGRFELRGVADARFHITAHFFGLASGHAQGVRPKQSPIRLTLRDNGSIVGVVRDAATGLPVETFSIKVTLVDKQGGPGLGEDLSMLLGGGLQVVDAEGRFEVGDRAPGMHTVVVRAEGYVDQGVEGVHVAEGQTSELVFELDRGGAIEGRVLDELARPIFGAKLTLKKETKERGGSSVTLFSSTEGGDVEVLQPEDGTSRTDAEGYFVLGNLPAGEITISVKHRDYRNCDIHKVRVVRGETKKLPKSIVLSRGVTVRGRLRHREGKELGNIKLLLHAEGKGDDMIPVRVASDGTFHQDGLAEGSFRLSLVSSSDGQFTDADEYGRIQFSVKKGETKNLDLEIK